MTLLTIYYFEARNYSSFQEKIPPSVFNAFCITQDIIANSG